MLRRPAFRRYFTDDETVELVAALSGSSHEAPDSADVAPISRDPDDDYLVALAASAGAERVVTGDPDLLEVGSRSRLSGCAS